MTKQEKKRKAADVPGDFDSGAKTILVGSLGAGPAGNDDPNQVVTSISTSSNSHESIGSNGNIDQAQEHLSGDRLPSGATHKNNENSSKKKKKKKRRMETSQDTGGDGEESVPQRRAEPIAAATLSKLSTLAAISEAPVGLSSSVEERPDSSTSSPPKERRRLGKTHGRARKTGGEQSTSEGRSGQTGVARERQPPVLAPGGPGQGKPRKHTLSIAIPGSVVDNAQNRELKTYLVGEIARAAAVFEVDEIVVYDDLSVSRKGQGGVRDDSASGNFHTSGGGGRGGGRGGVGGERNGIGGAGRGDGGAGGGSDRNNPNVFMARLLQYAETPQYLRRQLFPMHPSLRLAGLLNPLDAPHHMRADDDCPFREGVVLDRTIKKGAGSFVDIGKRKEARIDRPLDAGVRVTVKLDKGDPCKKNHKGRAVPPSAPREELGLYWGYQTRLASGMSDVIAGCPFKGGYDLTLGTSERGSVTVDCPEFKLPTYRHVLVVFGGVRGIEATVDADETLQLPGSDASALFDMWVNTCPGQGSRTIRTEEAVLITLARLRQHVLGNGVVASSAAAVTAPDTSLAAAPTSPVTAGPVVTN